MILPTVVTIAGIIMSIGYFPQAYKIHKRKSSADVSISMYLMLFPGLVLWLIYGITLDDFPIIITNIVSLIGCFLVLIFWFRYSTSKLLRLSRLKLENP